MLICFWTRDLAVVTLSTLELAIQNRIILKLLVFSPPLPISYFQKEYIKSGIFDVKYSKYLSQAFQIRNNTDYADFFIVSREDAKEQYERAIEFIDVITEHLSTI